MSIIVSDVKDGRVRRHICLWKSNGLVGQVRFMDRRSNGLRHDGRVAQVIRCGGTACTTLENRVKEGRRYVRNSRKVQMTRCGKLHVNESEI